MTVRRKSRVIDFSGSRVVRGRRKTFIAPAFRRSMYEPRTTRGRNYRPRLADLFPGVSTKARGDMLPESIWDEDDIPF